MRPNPSPARRKASLAPRWDRRHTLGDSSPKPPGRDRSEGSACTSWMCSERMAAGIGAPWFASGCCGETTMGDLNVSSRSPVSCGGTTFKDAMTPTAQRPSSTGSITALDSISNLSKVVGNSFRNAATVAVNGASGNTTSTATLSSGSRPLAKRFARAFSRSMSPATARASARSARP